MFARAAEAEDMNIRSMTIPVGLALALAAPFAFAQDSGMAGPHPAGTAPVPAASGMMMGEHSMGGTVTAVGKSGMVDVRSEGMMLRLHFPDAAKNLKKGDKITVHLGYSIDAKSGAK